MDYNQSITANKSLFVPDSLNYYGNNSISFDTSCFFNLNGSTPSQMGEVSFLNNKLEKILIFECISFENH